jgi:uncharacterized protein (TIGR02186 family)
MRRIGALILSLAALPLPAAAQAADPRLVPDVSSRAIDIQYSFTGEELLLFGAILYPGQRLPDDRADIVVVLKGPVRPVILREKRRVAGIWVNANSLRLRTSPGFYAIGSSRPIDKLVDERTAAIFELGLSNLSMSPTGFSEAKKLERFEGGLIDLYRRMGLFYENPAAVEITEGVLYRARIPVPARVPVGTYRAETYLISRGRVLAVASRDVQIRKAGFERFVALAAQRHGFLYGLTAVLLSLALGWGASAVFRRR